VRTTLPNDIHSQLSKGKFIDFQMTSNAVVPHIWSSKSAKRAEIGEKEKVISSSTYLLRIN
jgi:hypothetical protein